MTAHIVVRRPLRLARVTPLPMALVRAMMVLAACVPGSAIATSPTKTIDYEVSRQPDAHGEAYRITVTFRGNWNGSMKIRIPSEWASAQHAERGIDQLETMGPRARLDATTEPDVRRIVHPPGGMVRIRYRLRPIDPGEPGASSPTTYLPVMRPDYFEWIGWTTWIVPVDDRERVRVRVHFIDLPADWQFASSFGLERRAVSFDGPLQSFRASLFIGGDFRLRSRPVRGGRVVVAVRGAWPFRDGELADRVAAIINGERALWNDNRPRPDFLVALLPLATTRGARSSGGTGLSASFATWTTPITSLDALDRLFTHEYFHAWNAAALGELPAPEALSYWFSEGFTDYYTHLLRLRWKMLTLESYAAEYDHVLRALAESREGGLPNAAIAPRFFSEGGTVGKLPYWRGMLLAARWDAQIRRASGGRRSLDDAMRALRAQHRAGVIRLDTARIVGVMKAAGVDDAAGDVDRLIDRGQQLVFDGDELTTCIRFAIVTEPAFDVGFDAERSIATKEISAVDADGPAYAAGLRDGQRLRSIHLQFGDIERPVEVGVQDGDGLPVQHLQYRPLGKAVARQSPTLQPGLEDDERSRCLGQLGAGGG